MDNLKRRKLKALLHKEIIDTIAQCVGDGYNEDFLFAFEYVKQLMETEISYFKENNEEEEEEDIDACMRESLEGGWW